MPLRVPFTPSTYGCYANNVLLTMSRESHDCRLIFRELNSGTYQLTASQRIALPREEVFTFFKDPRNLSEITPDWLHFRMLDIDAGAEVFEGAEYDYTIRWFPVAPRTRWRSRIARYDPPEAFTDVQIIGPYAFWEHLHTFEEIPGGTQMVDTVTYRLPFGPMGQLAHSLFVRRRLEDIFSYRALRIREWATGSFVWKHKEEGSDNI